MNRRKIAGLLAALIPWLALAASATAQNDERVLYRNLPVQAKLERSMDFDFQSAPLSEVLQFFREKLRIAIVLDPASADLARKPITMTVTDVPAGTALKLALRQVRLQYGVSLGIVWVGDRAYVEEQEPLVYRQYDVADVTMSGPGGFPMAGGSADDASINKPRTGRTTAIGDEALCTLAANSGRRNADRSAASSSAGNSSIQKESKETGF